MTSEQAEKFAKKYGYAALIVEIENAIIERCAVKCDERAEVHDAHEQWERGSVAHVCAANIRALKVQL